MEGAMSATGKMLRMLRNAQLLNGELRQFARSASFGAASVSRGATDIQPVPIIFLTYRVSSPA
jgi:hypothetical protein